jgi:hypothetical protein
MCLAIEEGRSSVTSVQLMPNDLVGVKDCFGEEQLPLAEYRQILQQMRMGIRMVQVDRTFLERLVRHCLWIARRNRKPTSMDFSARRAFLGDFDLEPTPLRPDLSGSAAHAGGDVDGLRGTEALFDRNPYANWWYESPGSYAFVKKLPPSRRERPGRQDVVDFVRRFYAPDRERLLARLAWTLDLSARYGSTPEPPAAVSLYRALRDEIPLERIPFFRRAAEMSIVYTGHNLLLGKMQPADYCDDALV